MATGKATVPNLCAGCEGRPLLWILRFCGLILGTARRSQKWDRESAFLLFFYLSCACGGKKDRV